MRYVLDTNFFLAGMDPSGIDGERYITPEIKAEVEKGFPARKMEYYLESDIISIASPSEDSVEAVMRASEETGDIARLSLADISILALALELSAAIITDDYSVQNLASVLEISYIPLNEKGINEIWRWKYRCTGCGRIFDEWYEQCPICGSPLKTFSGKKRPKER